MLPCPCDGPDPADAYEHLRHARPLAVLLDEPHVIIQARRCDCGRAWLSVFTERIDFAGGDDPQRRELYPLDEPETARLLDHTPRPHLDEPALLALLDPAPRRTLIRDWPARAGSSSLSWETRPVGIAAHD